MLGELHQVKNPWEGTRWALGGAGVLVKQALVSLIMGRGRHGVVPDGGLFAQSAGLRRAALAVSGAFVLASFLFLGAPPFRQAFQVAIAPWLHLYQLASRNNQPGFEDLARRAEARRDAEALALCAVRLQGSQQSAALAQEAVRLEPNLLWVYAVVAGRAPAIAKNRGWIEQLERWDPSNALLPLLDAQAIESEHFRHGVWTQPTAEQKQRWQCSMATAFAAPEFDDYFDRVAQLTRRVLPRYNYYDPYEVKSRDLIDLPIDVFNNSERYAGMLLHSGGELESKGERARGRDRYLSVARFGQLMDTHAHSALGHWMGTSLQAMAYRQLEASYQKEGNQAEARLMDYLAEKFDSVKGEHPGMPAESAFGLKTAQRNAAVVVISALMSACFLGFVFVATIILLAGSRRGAAPAAQRARPVATIVIMASSVGLLFSSITLYLTYRPYWYIFQTAVASGDRVPTGDLRFFLNDLSMVPGVSPRGYSALLNALVYSGSPSFLFYVWTGVTLLGVIGLVLIFVRHFQARPRTHTP